MGAQKLFKNKNYLISWALGLLTTILFTTYYLMQHRELSAIIQIGLLFTVFSLLSATCSFHLFKKGFSKAASLKKHLLWGFLASLITTLLTCFLSVITIILMGILSGSRLSTIFSAYLLAYLLLNLFVLAFGTVASGTLLGFLNFKATSSHQ
jgi:hypothetical protein